MPLVFGAPCQLRSLAGQEHGGTIPLSDTSGRIDPGQRSMGANQIEIDLAGRRLSLHREVDRADANSRRNGNATRKDGSTLNP